jgi:carbon monoxide dehydrogenase subunit G
MPTTAFERDITVGADRQRCWSVLTDVPKLIDWVSIVNDATEIAPLEKYTAVLMDRLGPFKLKADLAIEVSEVVPGEHIRVRANGEDRQVSSRIGIDAVLVIGELPGGGSRVGVTGSYEVVGKVATMGAGMIRQKAAKILDEFFGHAVAALGAR